MKYLFPYSNGVLDKTAPSIGDISTFEHILFSDLVCDTNLGVQPDGQHSQL